MDVSGIGNPEAYFRANVWSWRPIHAIIDYINNKYSLGIETESFGYNDGSGVSDPEVCLKLSEGIKKELDNIGLKENDDTIYLALGSWVEYPSGKFVGMEMNEEMNLDEYNGKILSAPISTKNGLVVPAYSTDRDHVEEFCKFLEECEGFEIW